MMKAYEDHLATIYHGTAEDVLPTLPSASVDVVLTDPPYPEIDRPYGRMTEPKWHAMMDVVVPECRRILNPSGSAVFILQPNSERVGRMRPWLWEFMAKWTREWGMVQDAWWWNHTAPPTVHCHRDIGLMRPATKACVWLGGSTCYRNQGAVLWSESEANKATDLSDRALQRKPSGQSMRPGRCAAAARDRGGVTPFNLLPIPNANSSDSAGTNGHGAGTPATLCDWWLRYICPPGGTVCDPFLGSGTVAIQAALMGNRAIGIERDAGYVKTAAERVRAATRQGILEFGVVA